MIAKVFAQEAREHGRTLLIKWAIGYGLCALFLAGSFLPVPVISAMTKGAVFGALIALPLTVIVVMAAAYWRSMYGERGYFAHCLPVRGRDLFWGKALYMLAATTATATLTALAGAVALFTVRAQQVGIDAALENARQTLHAAGPRGILLTAAVTLVWLFANSVAIPAMMSVGAQARWNAWGFAVPAALLVAYYLINQILLIAATFLIPIGISTVTRELTYTWMLDQVVDNIVHGTPVNQVGLAGIVVVPLLALGAAAWAVRVISTRTSLR